MEQNEQDIIESTNDTETTENTEVELNLETEEANEDEVAELKKKLATTEAQKEHWRTKAQKKEETKETTTEKAVAVPQISIRDTIALSKADVHEDDLEEVLEYAQFKKISIADALKADVIKKTLSERKEHRETANATNTSKNRGANSKVPESALLAKAEKTGELPESDEELNRMLSARYSK